MSQDIYQMSQNIYQMSQDIYQMSQDNICNFTFWWNIYKFYMETKLRHEIADEG